MIQLVLLPSDDWTGVFTQNINSGNKAVTLMSLLNKHCRSTDMEAIKFTKQRVNVRKILHSKGYLNVIYEMKGGL